MDDALAKQYSTMSGYKHGYAEWFLRPLIETGLARTTGERRLVVQLPDEWDFRYDPADAGEKGGWFQSDVPAEGWRKVTQGAEGQVGPCLLYTSDAADE